MQRGAKQTACMPPTSQHLAAERALRELLPQADLPQPDEVEYREESVVFLWHEQKLAVFIDLDDPPQQPERRTHVWADTGPAHA